MTLSPAIPIRSACALCSLACPVELSLVEGRLHVGTTPVPGADHPVVCPLLPESLESLYLAPRLDRPSIRGEGACSWERAVHQAARRLQRCVDHRGPGSVAVLCSSSATLEAQFLARALAVEGLDTTQVGCMTHGGLRGLRQDLDGLLGHTRSTAVFTDVDQADLILVVGADPVRSHPGLARRIQDAVARGATLAVLHSNWVELGAPDGLWLDPRRGSMSHLLLALRHELIDQGCAPAAVVSPEVLAALVARTDHSPTGVEAGGLRALAACLLRAERVVTVYDLDDTCERSDGDLELLACLLLELGQLAGPGRGLLLLRAEANAAGGALLENHEDLGDLLASGRLAGLVVLGEDPLGSPTLSAGLRGLEALVVLDAYPSRTAEAAHVVLPCPGPLEVEGTFIAGDGRVRPVRPLTVPPAEYSELALLAHLCRTLGGVPGSVDPEEIRAEICLELGLASDHLERLRSAGGRWDHVPPMTAGWRPDTREPTSWTTACSQLPRLRAVAAHQRAERELV